MQAQNTSEKTGQSDASQGAGLGALGAVLGSVLMEMQKVICLFFALFQIFYKNWSL